MFVCRIGACGHVRRDFREEGCAAHVSRARAGCLRSFVRCLASNYRSPNIAHVPGWSMSTGLVIAGALVLIASVAFSVKSIIDTRRRYYEDYLKRTGRGK